MSEIKITWHGHACFTVEKDNYKITFDPFSKGSVPGVQDVDVIANEVLCSHEHGDHNARDLVKLVKGTSPFKLETVNTFHDDVKGAKRGKNIIHILTSDGMRIAHFGDLGHPLSEEQIQALGHLDVVMIPVGGFFTIDAKTAYEQVKKLNPNVVIPMHYKSDAFGFDVIGSVDAYTALVDDVVLYDTNELIYNKEIKGQTAILKCPTSK